MGVDGAQGGAEGGVRDMVRERWCAEDCVQVCGRNVKGVRVRNVVRSEYQQRVGELYGFVVFSIFCGQCPTVVLFVSEKFFKFAMSNGLCRLADILKVFSRSLIEDVEVFISKGINEQHSFLV